MEILLINSCVRKKSRTIKLARKVAKKLGGNITEVFLEKERIKPLYGLPLVDRDILLSAGELWCETFDYAQQFAAADIIVIAAPFWDLSFPAILKIYLETINVTGITFEYLDDGSVRGLCKAKKLYYVTTAGGEIPNEAFGYGYVKSLANMFWGIHETHMIKAEGLDRTGADVNKLMDEAVEEISID